MLDLGAYLWLIHQNSSPIALYKCWYQKHFRMRSMWKPPFFKMDFFNDRICFVFFICFLLIWTNTDNPERAFKKELIQVIDPRFKHLILETSITIYMWKIEELQSFLLWALLVSAEVLGSILSGPLTGQWFWSTVTHNTPEVIMGCWNKSAMEDMDWNESFEAEMEDLTVNGMWNV